jgi:hypothetical protein
MKLIALLFLVATSADAQDSSFSTLRIRGGLLRNPIAGHISEDWSPGTGLRGEFATNVGKAELGLGLAHLAYNPTTGKPSYTATIFSLSITRPLLDRPRGSIDVGARLADYRMDFNDASLVGGLRTEEEVLLSAVGRARARLHGDLAVFGDVSYGVLMLGTKTPMGFVTVGAEYDGQMPGWLRGLLR